MRVVLGTVLVAFGVAATPPAVAEPYNCPPACDSIPDSAWIAPAAIPLDSGYGWPPLAPLSVPAPAPRFAFEELCASPLIPSDPRGYVVAERAVVSNAAGQWQLQAQVLHWRGETWRGAQLVQDSFAAALSALRSCQRTNPVASPSLTLEEPDRFAAVISGPTVLHQYLVANSANSTITELALWSTAPPLTPWPTPDDATVLEALGAPLCIAYIDSCP